MKKYIALLAAAALLLSVSCAEPMTELRGTVVNRLEQIGNELPNNSFAALFMDGEWICVYCIDGKKSTSAYSAGPDTDLRSFIRSMSSDPQGDANEYADNEQVILNYAQRFMLDAVDDEQPWRSPLFEDIRPIYGMPNGTTNVLTVKAGLPQYPYDEGSNAYCSVSDEGFSIFYYGVNENDEQANVELLVYIGAADRFIRRGDPAQVG